MIAEKKIAKGIYWSKALSLISGCSPVSEACQNCWLAEMEYRFNRTSELLQIKNGTIKPIFNGNVIFNENRLDIPFKTKKPQVFAIWSDLFHQSITHKQTRSVYDAMAVCDRHIFLILTKRDRRMAKESENLYNVWHGITCETQQRADERIPYLLQVPGNKFLSLEPLLGEIDLSKYIWPISAIVVGAESGLHRRPCKIEWIRSVVEQARNANIKIFVKQIHDKNRKVIKNINEFPKDLRRRELAWQS
jgi:protein gp37